jgi:O-acetyl-ADP-ribose deacetylase
MASTTLHVGKCTLEARSGNIVEAGTEAIVNAANARLAGGGGVDGAIHRVAGPELYKETSRFGGCPTGSAVITSAGQFPPPTRYIIHAVGPIYDRSEPARSAELLASAYGRSLELAGENRIESVAFPSISTGAYGYPIEDAAPIAIATVAAYLEAHPNSSLRRVLFVLFSGEDLEIYERLLKAGKS